MVELNEKALEAGRDRLIHILVVHFDMFREKAEEAADLFLHDKTLSALPAPDDGLAERLRAAYAKVAEWPEYRMAPDAVAELGSGFTDLLEVRNLVPEAATALQSQAEQIERLTRERDEADNALVDKYRDPQTGTFSFPGDVASIVRRLDTAEASLAAAREALKPFAGDKLPGNNRDLIEYDRHGLRRSMSPMEIARRNAFFTLHPDQHPLAKAAAQPGAHP